ncbi:hypothetical protein DL767_009280 [Monosporascus sp. MG133]|nr:hypothetical protein DL767_009280 [Monosporascus sp. MG133]
MNSQVSYAFMCLIILVIALCFLCGRQRRRRRDVEVKPIVWFRSGKLAVEGRVVVRFDTSFYGFVTIASSNLKNGSIINVQGYKPITIGNYQKDGTILLLGKSSKLSVTTPDEDNAAPRNQQFPIATNAPY